MFFVVRLIFLRGHDPPGLPRPFAPAAGRSGHGRVFPSADPSAGRQLRDPRPTASAGDPTAEAARVRRRGLVRHRNRGAPSRLGAGESGGEEEMMDEKHNATKETMQSFGTLGSVGFAFVISIVMGAGLGLLIDRWIGAGHW